ncbi:hypothetical protein B0H10DRAFT_10761 [Mycena sp. CBHHK59/15]|nr:hypothetical protein B0H10DRAFT_10761 [Mycena sp. CBHHK59/15]
MPQATSSPSAASPHRRSCSRAYAAPRFQDRITLAVGSGIGTSGLVLTLLLLATDNVVFGSFSACWFLVALGFNLASTRTLMLFRYLLLGSVLCSTSPFGSAVPRQISIQYSDPELPHGWLLPFRYNPIS